MPLKKIIYLIKKAINGLYNQRPVEYNNKSAFSLVIKSNSNLNKIKSRIVNTTAIQLLLNNNIITTKRKMKNKCPSLPALPHLIPVWKIYIALNEWPPRSTVS